jgi:Uma2 family endonuclease
MILRTLHLSLADYDAMIRLGAFDHLNKRIELIRGEIVETNPAGPVHDDFVTYLNTWSAENHDRLITRITSQTGLDLPEIESRPEPDVFWIRRARYRDGHPRAADVQLAIEVSDSSLQKDLEIKRKMYAEVGVREYWIVDCQSRSLHIFRDPSDGDYQTVVTAKSPEVITPLIAPHSTLDLHDLFEADS